jgi:hypothetical protein
LPTLIAETSTPKWEILSVPFLITAIWVPAIAMAIALFVRKMNWLGTGLVGAVLANTAIWVFGSGGLLKYGPELVLFPWPPVIGLLILN